MRGYRITQLGNKGTWWWHDANKNKSIKIANCTLKLILWFVNWQGPIAIASSVTGLKSWGQPAGSCNSPTDSCKFPTAKLVLEGIKDFYILWMIFSYCVCREIIWNLLIQYISLHKENVLRNSLSSLRCGLLSCVFAYGKWQWHLV